MTEELTSKQRKYLKGMAHNLKPFIQVGRAGVSPEFTKNVEAHLNDHELIKVKFNEFKDKKSVLSKSLSKKLGAHLVDIMGNTLIIYREHPIEDKREIKLP